MSRFFGVLQQCALGQIHHQLSLVDYVWGSSSVVKKCREETHYFSTQGCSAGSTVCFTEFLLDEDLVAKKLDAIAVERRGVSRTRDGRRGHTALVIPTRTFCGIGSHPLHPTSTTQGPLRSYVGLRSHKKYAFMTFIASLLLLNRVFLSASAKNRQ